MENIILESLSPFRLRAACIDDSYDLSEAMDNSNIGIGTDETSFTPCEVNVVLSQITSDGEPRRRHRGIEGRSSSSSADSSLSADEVSTLLPENLEGEYEGGRFG